MRISSNLFSQAAIDPPIWDPSTQGPPFPPTPDFPGSKDSFDPTPSDNTNLNPPDVVQPGDSGGGVTA